MAISNFPRTRKIPTKVTTKKSVPTTTNFAKGIYTYKPNDAMDLDEIYLAQNARFDRIGEYKTRCGLHNYAMTNEAITIDNWGEDYVMVDMPEIWIIMGEDLVNGLNGSYDNFYSITIYAAPETAEDVDVIKAKVVASSEDPYLGDWEVYSTCARVTGPGLITFYFKQGFHIPTDHGSVWLYLSLQNNPKHKIKVGVDPITQRIKLFGYKIIPYRQTGKVLNMFEANISESNGTISSYILFAFQPYVRFGTDSRVRLCRTAKINTTTGNPTPSIAELRILPSGVKNVRFSQDGNVIRYADGVEGPRMIDPLNNWADSAIDTIDLKTGTNLNIKVSNILTGTEDNIIYFDADTNTQAVWTYPYGFQYAKEADFITSAAIAEYVPGATTTTTIQKSTLTPTSDTHLVSALATGDLIVDGNDNYATVTSISGNDITVTSTSHVATPINSYDKFDRDFRQNFPAIKTGDPLTAMFNLGGIIYFMTRKHKYYMYSQTADNWTQQASTAQHGTFSQESCVCDLNYAYYACDDGIYVFDGATETSITKDSIQATYDLIPRKENIRMQLFNNRLYVFYRDNYSNEVKPENTYRGKHCLVYNINLKVWESFDSGLPIEGTLGQTNGYYPYFVCGSDQYCALFFHEFGGDSGDTDATVGDVTLDSIGNINNYADLGSPIDFDLETSYLHFGTPSQLHRITKWRPEFAKVKLPAQSGYVDEGYSVKCGYALDFTNEVKYAFSVNLKDGSIWNDHLIWDNPPAYGINIGPTKLSTIPQVNGQFYRCQIRYQMHGAYTPVNFKSMTISVETQRLR